MALSEGDRDLLHQLEARLLDAGVRNSPGLLDGLLDDDFQEFGASGRSFDKAQIMSEMSAETGETAHEIRDFQARALGDGLALVTYRGRSTKAGEAPTEYLRGSIWRRTGGSWKILFHQGTPIPAGPAEPAER